MSEIMYRDRRAVRLETAELRVTATMEGCHIAEILHKATGVNPLWTPPWPSIEPSQYDRAAHSAYGDEAESMILAGMMGHSICLDTYGGPSPEELAAGMPIHGEGAVVVYQARGDAGDSVSLSGTLPLAQIRFERGIRLAANGTVVCFRESVENLAASDRPIAWTQHAILGPPFLERGRTQFRAPVVRSKVIDTDFGGAQKTSAEFTWPLCPRANGGVIDLRVFPDEAVSGGFTTHLLNAEREHAHFISWSPSTKVVFGYVWKREDFPWLCRWEENHLRKQPPWNGCTITCGMEFGVSPTVESRRQMVTRGELWDVPAYRWLPAKSRLETAYCAFITTAESIPESVRWDGRESVELVF